MKKSIERKLDKEFFEWLKKVRGGKCERCGATKTLQPSHVYSRTYRNTRWHPLNATLACAACQFWWHKNPPDAVEWVQELMGETYGELRGIHHTGTKPKTAEEVREVWASYA